MKGASPTQRQMLHSQYKKLRNKANCLIKNDSRNFNNERLNNAKDEKEIWRIANEITVNGNEQIIADKFFVMTLRGMMLV